MLHPNVLSLKQNKINQFLVDVLEIHMAKDLGISLEEFTTIVAIWSQRLVISSSIGSTTVWGVWLGMHTKINEKVNPEQCLYL